MKIKNVFTVLFLMWGLTGALAQINLSFNPENGARYEYHVEMTQNIKQSVMGQEMPVVMVMNTKYLMEIVNKTAQEITVRFTYKEIAYSLSSLMMRMEYDSRNPVENLSGMDQILGKMLGAMIGQSVNAVFAPDGSVKSVTGMEAIGESMVSAIANEGLMGAQLGAQLKQQFNDDAMKGMFEQSFRIYPARPVNVGASWNVESMMMVNNMNTGSRIRYTLREVSNNMAIVAVEGEIEISPGAGMEGNINGTQTGTMTVDIRTGIPTASELLQNTRGSVRAQGIDVQMEIVANINASIQKIN